MAAIQKLLADGPNLEQKLEYIRRDPGIIQFIGPAEDKVRVSLDPVAEYIAGLHLLELYSANEARWYEFLTEADKKEGAPRSIEGFLLAVKDCCPAKGKDYGVPEFVEGKLARRPGLPRKYQKSRLSEWRHRLIVAHCFMDLSPSQ